MEKKSTPTPLDGKVMGLRTHILRSCHQQGISTIAWVMTIPVLLIVPLIIIFIFYEGRKAYWDGQVKEMCAKDGGVSIIEQINVSSAQAKLLPKVGDYFGVNLESLSKPEELTYSRVHEMVLREYNPVVIRYRQEIIRRSDRRVIGIAVSYGRGGGDFPGPSHPSSFHCPKHKQIYEGISKVYKIEEVKK